MNIYIDDIEENTTVRFITVIISAMLCLLTGCSVNDKKLAPDGQLGGACFANGTCDSGFSCEQDYCVEGPDGGSGVVPQDAFVYQCNDDSMFEPNDTFATSMLLAKLGTTGTSESFKQVFSKMAICPATDQDYFTIQVISSVTQLDVSVTYDSPMHGGAPLFLNLYDPAGSLIGTGATSGQDKLDVTVANPTGSYVFLVNSDDVGEDNYSVTVSVTP